MFPFVQQLLLCFCRRSALDARVDVFVGLERAKGGVRLQGHRQGKDVVEEIGCSSTTEGNGELVMFTCPLDTATTYSTFNPNGDFSDRGVNFFGAGLKTVAEMYQCVESVTTHTSKDSVGGGTTTTKTYHYTMKWSSTHETMNNPTAYRSTNMYYACGISSSDPNPSFPAGLPTGGSQYSTNQIKVGDFSVDFTTPSSLFTLDSSVTAASVPYGWTFYGWTSTGYTYYSSQWERDSHSGLGRVRVTFYGNDKSQSTLTILGENENGAIKRWTAADSWLCSGWTLAEARFGDLTKDNLFESMDSSNFAILWILRLVGFCVAWFAWSRLAGPLEVVADCIPCVGPCLGDMVEAVACCVSIFPACACGMLVCGIVWVVMRPMIGIPLMIIPVCMFTGYLIWKFFFSGENSGGGDGQEV